MTSDLLKTTLCDGKGKAVAPVSSRGVRRLIDALSKPDELVLSLLKAGLT